MTDANSPAQGGPGMTSKDRWKYGLLAVMAGLAAIVVCFTIASMRYTTAADVSTALAPVIAAIGTLAGTYFGIQVGAAGKQEADESKNRAQDMALRTALLSPVPSDDKLMLFGIHPQPSPQPSPPPSPPPKPPPRPSGDAQETPGSRGWVPSGR